MRLRVMTVLLPIGLLAAGMWALRWILAVDKGLDLGDEALYILAATAPSPEYFWTNPWGWITRPLWQLTGERLDNFRWGGASLLFLSFTALSMSVLMASARATGHRSLLTPGAAAASVPIGLAAALISYSGFLRSPGYNWVNLFGMTLTVAGAILWVTLQDRVTGRRVDWSVAAVIAAGLVVSGIGKPTTPILEAMCLIALGFICLGRRYLLMIFARIGVSASALLLCMWLLGWLGHDPVSTIALVLQQPQLGPQQTPLGALLVSSTVVLHAALWAAQYWYFSLYILLASVLLISRRRLSVPEPVRLTLLLLAGMLACAIWIGILPAASRGHNYMLRPEAVLGTLGLLVATVCWAIGGKGPADDPPSAQVQKSARWRYCVFVLLCVQPLIYAFGTSNGPFQGMTWALGFLFLAALFAVSAVRRPFSVPAGAVVATTLVLSSAWGMVEGRDFPYGMKPISEQMYLVHLGQSRYPLLVDEDMRRSTVELQALAIHARLAKGADVATVVFQWSTLAPVVLGAEPPPSLMVTLFGSPYSARIAQFNVGRPTAGFRWDKAALVLRSSTPPGSGRDPAIADVVGIVAKRAGLSFPEGYALIGEEGDMQLWAPSSKETD